MTATAMARVGAHHAVGATTEHRGHLVKTTSTVKEWKEDKYPAEGSCLQGSQVFQVLHQDGRERHPRKVSVGLHSLLLENLGLWAAGEGRRESGVRD